MKNVLKIVLLVLLPIIAHSQQNALDSLHNALYYAKDDSAKWNLYEQIGGYYYESNRDSSLKYTNKSLTIAEKNNKVINAAYDLTNKGYQLTHLGFYAKAFECLQKAFTILEDSTNESKIWWDGSARIVRLQILDGTHHMFAILMRSTGNTASAIFHFNNAKAIAAESNDSGRIMLVDMNLGNIYLGLHKPDTALLYESHAETSALHLNEKAYLSAIYGILGEIYESKRDTAVAKQYFYSGIQSAIEQNNYEALAHNYRDITKLYLAQKNRDSSLYYALKTLKSYKSIYSDSDSRSGLGENYYNLSESYKLNNLFDSSYKYLGLAYIANDSSYSRHIKNLAAFQAASLNENIRLQQLQKDRIARENKTRTIGLLIGIGVFVLIAILLFINNHNRRRANIQLEKQKNQLQLTVKELQSTQAQLIHSEKMASLGELTAGIAHEIQNPLNFVNNFSEVNNELIEEMNNETDIHEIKAIANDIKQNNEKIAFHGRRADSIVKNMLQHSRQTKGVKEPTDINALCNEYLRLAYHGMRAKDKSFNADFKTEFDESVGKINIVPQDIGRVLLNLFNNAFYAVNEKTKLQAASYKPHVIVQTKKINDKIEIIVKDNGNGIPQNVIDKIFQPFFTTKPTGSGTGLGLSLSYDIIKARGGEIKVETKEGEGTAFTVLLPL
jgi:signal transduction histidine kinase